MKLTKNQQKDLESIIYFIPSILKNVSVKEEDIKMFFENSERGMHQDKVRTSHFNDGFNALIEGKRWRGIHMQMWEEGILDGVGYFILLGGLAEKRRWFNPYRWLRGKYYNRPIPRPVVDFMAKEMFRGIDAELIESIYITLWN